MITVSFEKSKTVSFASLIMKYILSLSSLVRLPVKLVCCIALGSASSFCCLLKSLQLIYSI